MDLENIGVAIDLSLLGVRSLDMPGREKEKTRAGQKGR